MTIEQLPFVFYHWMKDENFNVMVKNVRDSFALSSCPMVVLKNKLKLLKGEIKSWMSSQPSNDAVWLGKLCLNGS